MMYKLRSGQSLRKVEMFKITLHGTSIESSISASFQGSRCKPSVFFSVFVFVFVFVFIFFFVFDFFFFFYFHSSIHSLNVEDLGLLVFVQ